MSTIRRLTLTLAATVGLVAAAAGPAAAGINLGNHCLATPVRTM